MGESDRPPGADPLDASAADPVIASMRAHVERAGRPFGDAARTEVVLSEAAPFVEAARRAAGEGALERSPSWREARSFAWLLGYRLGDQGVPAPVAAAVVAAWRDAAGGPHAVSGADEVTGLMLDGYARGREDRVRAEAQRSLAEALPVVEIAPHVVLVVAAGALEPEGAKLLADRAAAYLLRRDARAALMDVQGIGSPSAAVLVELWSLASAARMLGVRMAVSGFAGLVAEVARAGGLQEEGESRFATMAEGVESVLRMAGVSLGPPPGLSQWLRAIWSGRRDRR